MPWLLYRAAEKPMTYCIVWMINPLFRLSPPKNILAYQNHYYIALCNNEIPFIFPGESLAAIA